MSYTLRGAPATVREVRDHVIARDVGCILRGRSGHVCRDKFGKERVASTLEHVTAVHHHTEGRRDDEKHTVALCEALNGGSMRLATHEEKEFMRARLRRLYPACDDVKLGVK